MKDGRASRDNLSTRCVCGLVFNRISVRFLMALVQWCSGYVSFLAAPLAAGYCQVLNREQPWFETPAI